MLREDVPWNEATGELTPLSGTWTPTVQFEARQNFVYVDPALHATPPNHGTVVYEATTTNTGYHTQELSIDTTTLSNGLHRLLIGTGNVAQNGTHSGVLVVPFVVQNEQPPPPAAYHPACEPTCDEQIEALEVKLAAIHELSEP
jgi:hypothetical protein